MKAIAVLALTLFSSLAVADPPVATTEFVVFPADCNAGQTLFGGKTLAEMDRCAAISARRTLYFAPATPAAVTIAVNKVRFAKAAHVKDLIIVSGEVIAIGEKTITVQVTVKRELGPIESELIAEGEFVFCAIDRATGKSVGHGLRER